MNNGLYDLELAKAEIQHKELIILVFFILQYAKLCFVQFYCNFFTKFFDVKTFKELEMDTEYLYLALTEK